MGGIKDEFIPAGVSFSSWQKTHGFSHLLICEFNCQSSAMKPSTLIAHTKKMAERFILHLIIYTYLEDMCMDQGHLRHSINHNTIVAVDGHVVTPSSTTLDSSSSKVVVDGNTLMPSSSTLSSSFSQVTVDVHKVIPLPKKMTSSSFQVIVDGHAVMPSSTTIILYPFR